MDAHYVLVSLWSALIAFFIVDKIYILRASQGQKAIFFIVIALCWGLLLFGFGMENQNKALYVFVFISLCCFIFFRLCIFCSALGAIIVLMATGVAEIISFIVFYFLIGYTEDVILNNVFVNTSLHISIFFIVIVIGLFIQKVVPNKLRCAPTHPKQMRLVFFFGFTLLLIGVNIYHLRYLSTGIREAFYGIMFFSYLMFNFIFLYVYHQRGAKLKENKELRIYIKTAARLSEELRNFKHNYFNLLHGMMGYIENNEWDKLREYFKDITSYSKKIDKSNFLNLQKIKNLSIVGLLAAKINEAQDRGISFLIDICENEENVVLSNYEFLEIFGIFLNNAIEAAHESKERRVIIALGKIEENMYIIIKNTYAEEIVPLLSLSDRGFSTKGDGRGYGLWIVSEILKKYPEVLHNTSIKGDYFIQELIIPIKKAPEV